MAGRPVGNGVRPGRSGPTADSRRFRRLQEDNMRIASPHEDERQTAVRYWRQAIEIAVTPPRPAFYA